MAVIQYSNFFHAIMILSDLVLQGMFSIHMLRGNSTSLTHLSTFSLWKKLEKKRTLARSQY